MSNDEFQTIVLHEIREMKKDISQRFDGVDQRFDGIDQRFDGIDQRFVGIDQRLDGIDQRLDSMDQRLGKVEHKLDVVVEQTAGLMEFRTETNHKLDKISDDQKSIIQVLGEHEISIRSLQRRPV
ncbi:hypothetical protein [Dehalobacter restrictus]|uniref:t-SNARE coiled-coil homology domain-containing protein n=1 Tax=Dehalobacter restrictus TaxID=55583 RepID=A0A857DL48_9FIRM|nr:hypothetical protein [Dehalobacter restrictus]QHA01533.1 hypothetical protein GQ588_13230 [Dehalobacter restrictus]